MAIADLLALAVCSAVMPAVRLHDSPQNQSALRLSFTWMMLGTVQLGKPYGAANVTARPAPALWKA
jgi:hypothetical protein